ncbi:MAG TPA: hypothetical protein VF587_08175 [Solirubrobacteraceae bacterium]|jgi:hypothetical protein
MGDRWFEEEELRDMARPTMERIVEAVDAGDLEEAKRLAREGQGEWLMLHDLMAESILSLISFVQEKLGDGGVKEAWEFGLERGWKRHHGAIEKLDRRSVVGLLAATWRAHSAGGVGEHPGRFTITEDDEKVTFTMNPCGSGQRLVRRGLYESAGYGRTRHAHDWSYGRADFPLYCTHCSFMNESLPIQWSGYPLYPSDPPEDYSTDPCTWYWYKELEDIPSRHWRRYGAVKPGSPKA